MKQIGRILKIILVFFVALICISLVWYAVSMAVREPGERPVPVIDYVLYLLGFGDLDMKDHYLQTVFSTLGLLTVTLLSSVFTVSLFELRSKVRIGKNIRILDKDTALLELESAGKDVYNLTATVIAKCGRDLTTQEEYFPFVAKKEKLGLRFAIGPGTPLYKYLRAVYQKAPQKPQLVLTVVYTDIESGQEYTMARKYQLSDEESDFLFDGQLPEQALKQRILDNTFPLNLAAVRACNAEDIDLSYGAVEGPLQLTQKEAFCACVHMNGNRHYEPDTFTMAVTSDLLGNDWTRYYDLGCVLKFRYRVQGNVAVTVELKYGENRSCVETRRLPAGGQWEQFGLDLRQLDREKLAQVAELCFTVFYKDVDVADPTGCFEVRNAALEVDS